MKIRSIEKIKTEKGLGRSLGRLRDKIVLIFNRILKKGTKKVTVEQGDK